MTNVTPPMSPIEFTDIINNKPTVNSSGWFKELMDSMNKYIKDEYMEDRITGNDYANVYLGSMQSAIDSTLKFVLEEGLINLKLETEKKNQDLIQAQIDKIRLDMAIAEEHRRVDLETKQQNLLLTKGQVEKIEQDVLNAKAQVLLTNQKVLTEKEQTSLVNASSSKVTEETLILKEQRADQLAILKQQVITAVATADLTKAKATTEAENTKFVTAKTATESENKNLVKANAALAGAKTTTEGANTTLVTNRATTETKNASYVTAKTTTEGKQSLLIEAQTGLTSAKTKTEASSQAVMTAQTKLYGTQAVAFQHKCVMAELDAYMKPHIIDLTQNAKRPFYSGTVAETGDAKSKMTALTDKAERLRFPT